MDNIMIIVLIIVSVLYLIDSSIPNKLLLEFIIYKLFASLDL